ncbi:MAG: hypothetical protein LBE02_07250 [Spirochaetaceae bacterium]|nr:hypothetical protein [Spirochaetaceae bacterium]
MATLLITFGLIFFVICIMSVGVIFGRKPLSERGCGGCESPDGDCAAGCKKYGEGDLSSGGPQSGGPSGFPKTRTPV